MTCDQPPRRQFLYLGCRYLALIPALVISGKAGAMVNAAARASVRYQDKPLGDKSCENCKHFVAGGPPTWNGRCRLFENDDEVSPRAYCVAWVSSRPLPRAPRAEVPG